MNYVKPPCGCGELQFLPGSTSKNIDVAGSGSLCDFSNNWD